MGEKDNTSKEDTQPEVEKDEKEMEWFYELLEEIRL